MEELQKARAQIVIARSDKKWAVIRNDRAVICDSPIRGGHILGRLNEGVLRPL